MLADLGVSSAEGVLAMISSALRLSACWRSWHAEAEFKGCPSVLWSDALAIVAKTPVEQALTLRAALLHWSALSSSTGAVIAT